jgi:hypothetical protein
MIGQSNMKEKLPEMTTNRMWLDVNICQRKQIKKKYNKHLIKIRLRKWELYVHFFFLSINVVLMNL